MTKCITLAAAPLALTPFLRNQGFQIAKGDKLALVLNSTSELNGCGLNQKDPRVAGDEYRAIDSDFRVVYTGPWEGRRRRGGATLVTNDIMDFPFGDRWKLCFCISNYGNCDAKEDFTNFVGVLIVKGPRPNTQHRVCVAGQPCTLGPFVGEGLSERDVLSFPLSLALCGLSAQDVGPYPVLRGQHKPLSAAITVSLTGLEDGDTLRGGVWRMCYCAEYLACAADVAFSALLGTMTIEGPFTRDQGRTCTAGVPCTLGPWIGQDLSTDDRVVFQSKSGHFVTHAGDPVSGSLEPGEVEVHTSLGHCGDASFVREPYSFGDEYKPVTAADEVSLVPSDLPRGGQWRMCYCTGGGDAGCVGLAMFGMRIGFLRVLGPSPNVQHVTCITGRACALGGSGGGASFTGEGLSTNDRVMLLLASSGGSCGTGARDAVATYGESKAVGAGGRATVGLSLAPELWRASEMPRGDLWKMCYCVANYRGCAADADFTVLLGELSLLGPSPQGQDASCDAGSACTLPDAVGGTFTGRGLSTDDHVIFLRAGGYCGFSARDGNALQNAAKALDASLKVALVRDDLKRGGQWVMCYCVGVGGCSADTNFPAFLGVLSVWGPSHTFQSKACVVGIACSLGELTGFGLSSSDKLGIIPCAFGADEDVRACCEGQDWAAFAGGSKQQAVTLSGSKPQVSLTPADVPRGGLWGLCLCANGACNGGADSISPLGSLTVTGPTALGQDLACVAGAPCEATALGGHLIAADDRVVLISGACGATDMAGFGVQLPVGAGTHKELDASLRYAVSSFDLPYGGSWAICHCAHLREDCSAAVHFGALLGTLTVRGPGAATSASCVAGSACSFGPISGEGLAASDKVLLVSEGGRCGVSSGDTSYATPGAAALSVTIASGQASFSLSAVQVTRAGRWKVCYCSSVGGCDAAAEFPTYVGVLTVTGPTPLGQDQTLYEMSSSYNYKCNINGIHL